MSDATKDWLKILVPAVFLAAIVLLWQIIHPALTRFVFYLLRSEDGRIYFAKYCGETMNDRLAQGELAASAVRTLQTDFETFDRETKDYRQKVDFVQGAHGVQLKEIGATVMEVPRLAESVDRIAESVEKFGGHLDRLLAWSERLQGREEERRHHQQDGSSRRRSEDIV